MIDINNNFRSKYNGILYKACGEVEEIQIYVLEERRAVHPKEDTRVWKKC